MPVYRTYSQVELDAQYNQHTLVPDISAYQAKWQNMSRRNRETLRCELDTPYGEHPAEKLDIFPGTAAHAPLLAFVHGGAWTQQSKDNSSYPARVFVEAGACFAAIGFGLVPPVTLDTQVRHVHEAIRWLYGNASRYGADPKRLYVLGHSSGAHLSGMLITTDWQAEQNLPPDVIRGATVVSGIYDLEPVRLSARNSYLRLDEAGARRNSPILRMGAARCPLTVGWGGCELDEFQRQSKEFAFAWRSRNLPCREVVMAELNHFDLADEFMRPDSELASATCEMMGLRSSSPCDPT